jgi:hypothetical protein
MKVLCDRNIRKSAILIFVTNHGKVQLIATVTHAGPKASWQASWVHLKGFTRYALPFALLVTHYSKLLLQVLYKVFCGSCIHQKRLSCLFTTGVEYSWQLSLGQYQIMAHFGASSNPVMASAK